MAEGERQAGDEEGGGKKSLAHWEFLPQPEDGELSTDGGNGNPQLYRERRAVLPVTPRARVPYIPLRNIYRPG